MQKGTLLDVLRRRADSRPETEVATYLGPDGQPLAQQTLGQLETGVRDLASRLVEGGLCGERVLLSFPPGIDFLRAFLACLWARVVAVPVVPPRTRRQVPRILAVASDCGPRALLTSTDLESRLRNLVGDAPQLAECQWWALEPAGAQGVDSKGSDSKSSDSRGVLEDPKAGDVAFLQYTSGSTASPKGVRVTHANLMANEQAIQRAFGLHDGSVVVGWLPAYHDMGLIGQLLQPIYVGCRSVILSPADFLQRPSRWLEAIHRYRGTVSGGPNFGYALAVERITAEDREGWDLSCWEVAFNGAEPVRPATLEAFADAYEPYGFRRQSFLPCYGLAEATLLVSGHRSADGPRYVELDPGALEQGQIEAADGGAGRRMVSCGRSADEVRVAVVDPESGRRLAPGHVGELWVAGPSVAQGYWNRAEESAATFEGRLDGDARRYLRTGDLGFLDGDELFVTGRGRDLIIQRGRNLYPQDIEMTVAQSHEGLVFGKTAAFTVPSTATGGAGTGEHLVVVQELARSDRSDPRDIAASARRAVSEVHEVLLHDLVLIRVGTLPITTSGKVRRRTTRQLYLEDGLHVVARPTLGSMTSVGSATSGDSASLEERVESAPPLPPPALETTPASEWPGLLLEDLRHRAAQLLGVPVTAVDAARPLTALGLDSLRALRLAGELERAWGFAVPVDVLLDSEDSRALVDAVLDSVGATPVPPIDRVETHGDPRLLPLSQGQGAMWFHHRLAPESAADQLAFALRIEAGLDADRLGAALEALVALHPALGATFEEVDGEPHQRLGAPAGIDYAFVDLGVTDGVGQDSEALRRWLSDEAWRPFDLTSGPGFRVRLVACTEDAAASGTGGAASRTGRVLLLVAHHIVTDFWSLAILFQDLGRLYGGGGTAVESVDSTAAYGAALGRRRALLEGLRGEELWDFWRSTLEGVPTDLELPTDRPRPAVRSFRGGSRRSRLSVDSAAVPALARRLGVTPFVVLEAAFQAWLYRMCGQREFIVGSPYLGRSSLGEERLVGYWVDTLPLVATVHGAADFASLVRRNRGTVAAALAHGEMPLSLLVERLQPVRDPSRPPLVQVLFGVQASPPGAPPALAGLAVGRPGIALDLAGIPAKSLDLERRSAQLDLSMTLALVPDGEAGEEAFWTSLEFAADLFDGSTAERFASSFDTLLRAAVAHPERALDDLPVLTEDERRQLLVARQPVRTPRNGSTIHGLVEASMAAHGGRVAVECDGRSQTYAELDQLSRRITRRVRQLGVGPETPVGVFLDRRLEVPAVLLGILRAGGAYVPLDPGYPKARVLQMMEDAGIRVLVTSEALRRQLPRQVADLLLLESLGPTVEGGEASTGGALDPGCLAYVIYTSGSTGRPKGVQIEHGSAVNLLVNMLDTPGLGPEDVLLSVTTLSFDMSMVEIFLPLVAGAKVCLASAAVAADGERLAATLDAVGATVLQATPVTWKLLMASGWRGRSGLRAWTGGEILQSDLAEAMGAASDEVWNLYGPTETTVYATMHRVEPRESPVAIGGAVANSRAHVVDPRLRLVPLGVPGELMVAGEALARGYLDRPASTAERFIPDPFSSTPGGRLYRTGDRVRRRRSGGAIECLGRADHQVKIRGFRIELGEIETLLRRHPALAEAVVAAWVETQGEPALTAYVVARDTAAMPAPEALQRHLRDRLPAVMVPERFVVLEAMPTTPNGKIDRRRLPRPEGRRSRGDAPMVPPRGPLEEGLAVLWAELLGLDAVGAADDFFALGGHSLAAARLAARVRDTFGRELPVRRILELPTVAEQARALEQGHGASVDAPMTPCPVDARRATAAQRRLWVTERLRPSAAYNMASRWTLEGPLDESALGLALGRVIERHAVLRTRYPEHLGDPRPVVEPLPEGWFERLEIAADRVESAATDFARRPFDLEGGPLLRVRLVSLETDHHELWVVAHHLVADGRSVELFFAEVGELYAATRAGRSPELPDLSVQVHDVEAWQQGQDRGAAQDTDLEYWRRSLEGFEVLELPTDRPRTARRSVAGATVRRRIQGDHATWIQGLGRRQGTTPFVALLTAFQSLLGRLSGQRDVVVGAPVSVREPAALEPLIGFFVDTVALRTHWTEASRFSELLARVRRSVLEAHAHRGVSYEQVVDAVAGDLRGAENPLAQVTFAVADPLPQGVWGSHGGDCEGGLRVSVETLGTGTAKFDLGLLATPMDDGLVWDLEYATDLFDGTTAERWLGHLEVLLVAAARNPDSAVEALPLLDAAARDQILALGDGGDARRSGGHGPGHESWRDVPAAVFEQIERRPDRVALAQGDRRWTYAELGTVLEGMVRVLQDRGVGPGDRVAVLMERGPEQVAACLSVLWVGAAYLPLDPAVPDQALVRRVGDASPKVLWTEDDRVLEGPWGPALGEGGPSVARVSLQDPSGRGEGGASVSQPRVAQPEHLAYVIYTSGSTGEPKGVAIPRQGLWHLVAWHLETYGVEAEDRTTSLAGLGFDATVWEVWPTLVAGARLELLPPFMPPTAADLLSWLAERRSDVAFLPTPLAEAVLAETPPETLALRTLLTGGDRLVRRPDPQWPCTVVNHYGPTEITVLATAGAVGSSGPGLPNLGRAIERAQVRVLDHGLEPCPLGVSGELFLGGPGLARGYWERAAATAERFVPDPFGAPGARLYRTGDLGRLRPDGCVDFLGRVDHQVQIRGLRIELGEVEAALGRQTGVRDAVVVTDGEGADRRLVAYVVTSEAVGEHDLRRALRRELPEAMVPALFVTLDALPLTANGKVDRRALPAPASAEGAAELVPPRSGVEALIADLWQETLGVDTVGVFDDFFALGGHSFHLMRVLARMRETFGVEITAESILDEPTVAGMTVALAEAMASAADDETLREAWDEVEDSEALGETVAAGIDDGMEVEGR